MFEPPPRVTAETFAELPETFRSKRVAAQRIASGRSVPRHGCFLEGPAFDRAGDLYVTDIPFGRVFKVDVRGAFTLVAEYDGDPNGLAIHRDGRIFIADYRRGLLELDPVRGEVSTLFDGYRAERFKGLNDLCFADNGDLYFTDQGQTGLNDPTGRVYRLRADGTLERVADNVPSPNGLVLNDAQSILYVAVTRANAVWRLPLLPDGGVSRMGVFIQLSGGRGPDGMAIDEEDGLTVAHPDLGTVWMFDRRGEPRLRIDSPRSDVVTNIAFGGAERKVLYIVDSEAGCILRAPVPVAGRTKYSHR
ncbi:MAG: SMP-30/gluconolactonase/LRE family protein [Proteobacteria bacterium]|nr:SMP-30/gluconolactonase/LRE family protein [Burkholderiales bacterium]